MNAFANDLRYGARVLSRNRGFTLAAVLALALGIGANSAIFSVVNALLLNPLPFKNLDRLVSVRASLAGQGLKATAVSPADFKDWLTQNDVFEQAAAYRVMDVTITGGGDPEVTRGAFVSGEFFSALDLTAISGRTPLAEENEPGRDQVAAIGYGLWQRRFAADLQIIGGTVTLNGRATTIVGVMPPNFEFPFGTELWMPLALTPQQMNQRETRNLLVLARLRSNVTVEQAQSGMVALAGRIRERYPRTNEGLSVQVTPLRDQQGELTRPLLSVLIGMALFLLLIASANVANLLFARATTRQKEIGIRTALGASRWRVIRQLMTESLVLAGLAGTLGLILAVWAVELIRASLPPDIAKFMLGWNEIRVDGRVLMFTLAVALITTLAFSLMPALQCSRPNLNEILKAGGRSNDQYRGGRARSLLVVSEIALALVLLVGAGLMVKGFWRVLNSFQSADPGSILTLQTRLPESKYKDERKVAEFYQQAIERLEALPGVLSVCSATNTPLNNSPNPSVELDIEGRPPLSPGERQLSDLVVISPNYFKIIGARLLSGRDFSVTDGEAAQPVAIISELAARRYWPGDDPLGRRMKLGGANPTSNSVTIVGVVSDLKQAWFDREIRPQVYLPYQQAPRSKMSFLVRTEGDPMTLATAVRSSIFSLDGEQPVEEMKTMAQMFADETSPFRFAAVLMLVLGAIAVVLAAVGVYGVMSYSVARRTHEIGVRMALGANRADVLRLIVGQGVMTAALGVGAGLPLAFALGRTMAGLLFGVVSLEYGVLIGIGAALALVAVLATCVPALRAARVDPMVALRCE